MTREAVDDQFAAARRHAGGDAGHRHRQGLHHGGRSCRGSIGALIADGRGARQQDRARLGAHDADRRDAGRLRHRRRHRLCRLARARLRRAARARCSPSSPRCCSPTIRRAGWPACRSGSSAPLVNARMIYEILDLEPQQRDAPDAARARGRRAARCASTTSLLLYATACRCCTRSSFTAEAGKTTAIVGASGAGKSTLVALLQRFYDLDGGRILIDGQDIAGVTKGSLRGSIAYVSQQPYLFEGTIARQHPLRPARRHRRRDRGGGAAGQCRRVHPPAAAGLRHAGRRKRRDAFGRPAPAPLDRARHRAQRADPAARRGDLGARQRIGGARAAGARRP